MSLEQRLGLPPIPQGPISLVGSGGKTTLLYLLAQRYAQNGLAVAVTTTTHIMQPSEFSVYTGNQPILRSGEILVCGTPAEHGKLSAPQPETLDLLCARADVLLIEADGSKRLPLKFPAAHEPVLLPQTAHTIAVAGLSALGRPLGEVCHRAALASERLGLTPSQPVTAELIAQLLFCGYGGIPGFSVLLNQADTPELLLHARQIAAILHAKGVAHVTAESLIAL